MFWEKFSVLLGESATGIAFWATYANSPGDVYKKSSFFPQYEFPKMTSNRVTRLVVIDIYDRETRGETCGEGTLAELQYQAVAKYGEDGFHCYVEYGNPFDPQQIIGLAHNTVLDIRIEQEGT